MPGDGFVASEFQGAESSSDLPLARSATVSHQVLES